MRSVLTYIEILVNGGGNGDAPGKFQTASVFVRGHFAFRSDDRFYETCESRAHISADRALENIIVPLPFCANRAP